MKLDNNIVSGGSGGDTGMTDKGNQVKSAKHTYQIGGNQVVLVSRKPTPVPGQDETPPDPSRVILLAGGSAEGGFIDDGNVDVRGCKGVRITSGPLAIPMVSPETSSSSTDGIEIMTAATQPIRIQRGQTFPDIQIIDMQSNNIIIDAGLNGSLSLRAGMSFITIDLTGITIGGVPMTQINPATPPLPPIDPVVAACLKKS